MKDFEHIGLFSVVDSVALISADALVKSLPGFVAHAQLAPAGVSRSIVAKLNAGLRNALTTPEFRKRMENLGFTLRDYPVEDYKPFVVNEGKAWAEYIRISKLTPR